MATRSVLPCQKLAHETLLRGFYRIEPVVVMPGKNRQWRRGNTPKAP
jgi:hypothetical protein